ncbi:hypothetical protein OH786_20300 [Streptomyces atratus]|uniref:Uncharacterized protein n=1 Tax=Streptomyces atratus TaxID=1893 RepID=A0A1K2DWG1_STRAR|nr:hypothetical protein [Streptomyces atratus]SFY27745.1 hypothetical protein SAMN02787144_10163 [Streptomyces atratus]
MDHSVTPSVGRRSASSLPYVLFGGSLLLLVALFAVSYGVGRLAGPVAPGMHGVPHHDDDPGMGDMGGMGHGGGH